jgi:hypothetical protein
MIASKVTDVNKNMLLSCLLKDLFRGKEKGGGWVHVPDSGT